MSLRFSVEHGGVTRTFDLKKSVVTLGRSHACTVFVDDPALSRTHCQLELEEGGCFVRDLNSRNGTYVDEKRIDRVHLSEGAEIVIGTTQITFLGCGVLKREGRGLPAKTSRWTERLFSRGRRAGPRLQESGEESRDARKLRKLLQLNRQIAAEIEPERVLSSILDAAIEFADAERGFLMTVEEGELFIPVARDFWKKDIPAPAFEVSRSIALEVVRRARSVITEDASEDSRFEEMVSVYNLKIRSVLCVPLINQGKVVGAIYLDNRFTRGSFSAEDIESIEAFADQAAISLVNSGIMAKEREVSAQWRREARRRLVELESVKSQLSQLDLREGLGPGFDHIIGRSHPMRACLKLAGQVARSDLSVLILGESGSGKELLARALHNNSERSGRPFVPVHCAAMPEGLIETELFGHGRGAFSGSGPSRAGLIETADGGTLFLDEIGDMPEAQQRALLRVLESGEVRRVGEQKRRSVNVRVVAATHQDLDALMAAGRFRQDLYFRLKGVELHLPPLRDRRDDIPALVKHFASREKDWPGISDEALRVLQACDWPGNVRQLASEVRRLALVAQDVITAADLAEEIRLAAEAPLDGGLKGRVEALERQILAATMRRFQGNKTRVAEALGLSRLGLRKKLARYGMDED